MNIAMADKVSRVSSCQTKDNLFKKKKRSRLVSLENQVVDKVTIVREKCQL